MLSATTTNSTITRQVTFKSVAPYQMGIDVPSRIAGDIGASVRVTLTLPTGLDQSLFPLEIIVLTNNSSLSSSYPVVTGLNSDGAPDANGQYFGYKVTIDADEYFVTDSATGNISNDTFNNVVELTGFKLNTALSVGTKTTVKAYNPNFNNPSDTFTIAGPYGLGLVISGFTANSATATFTTNTTQQDIEDWEEDARGKYIEFDFTYSNSSVSLTGATFNGITDQQKENIIVDDVNNKLRVYQTIYEDGITSFELTFTSTSSIMGTTITAQHEKFGTASATVEKLKLTWAFTDINDGGWGADWLYDSNRNNQSSRSHTLRITLPSGVSVGMLNGLAISVTSTNTNVTFDGTTTISSGSGSYSPTFTQNDITNRYKDINVKVASTGNSGSVTFSLTSDSFESPDSMTFSKSRNTDYNLQ